MSTSNFSYFDDPTITSDLQYYIAVSPPSVCQSTKAQDHNASRSNTTSSVIIGNGTDGINENLENNSILIFPNPSTSAFNVMVNDLDLSTNSIVNIYDINGRLIKAFNIDSNQFKVDLLAYESGVYVLEIKTNDYIIKKQLVKK